MKAAIRRNYISPENLKVEETDVPSIGDDEVLVEVFATTVNRTDCAVLTGKPWIMRLFIGLQKPRRAVPGTDFAGRIAEVGSKISSFKVGDDVFGFNDEGLSTQAQFVGIKEKEVFKMPSGINYLEAAASLEGAHYAINFLNKVSIKPEQKVLINGATGAIGSAVLQMIKAKGNYVCAVCNGRSIPLIQSLGADKIYNYETEDFLLDKEKYDFVLDAVGKSTFGKCKKLMTEDGIYVSSELGPNAQNPFLALWTGFFGKKKVKFPLPSNIPKSIKLITELTHAGSFKPVIDRSYSLDQISDAYVYVNSGEKIGNVLIDMNL